jgi:hypothetical protein
MHLCGSLSLIHLYYLYSQVIYSVEHYKSKGTVVEDTKRGSVYTLSLHVKSSDRILSV